jgi:hypothetical protein
MYELQGSELMRNAMALGFMSTARFRRTATMACTALRICVLEFGRWVRAVITKTPVVVLHFAGTAISRHNMSSM